MISTPSDLRATCSGRRTVRSTLMNFHDITMTSITGDQVSFADYEGKLALVVNVASQ